jgi:hypothetical protein
MPKLWPVAFVLLTLVGSCRPAPNPAAGDCAAAPYLAGDWRASLQFTSGAFAAVKYL